MPELGSSFNHFHLDLHIYLRPGLVSSPKPAPYENTTLYRAAVLLWTRLFLDLLSPSRVMAIDTC